MAERGSCVTTNGRGVSEGGGPVVGSSGMRRVVALRPTVRRRPDAAPAWVEPGATGAWRPSDGPVRASRAAGAPGQVAPAAGARAQAVAGAPGQDAPVAGPRGPLGAPPFAPDPEAAAFLNAPRRPLDFYVAPFGTPPFGNPPTGSGPSPSRATPSDPDWGPAYPAGA